MKKINVLLLAAIAVLLIFGCRKETASGTVRYIGFKVYDPVYIAMDKGFFEKHGVNVEIIDFIAAGPNALQAVSGGSAEACLSATMSIIAARAQGLPVIAVSDIQSSIGNQALEEFFVRKDSGINSITDLKGKTIAINIVKASFHYTWLIALEAAGLSENDVNFVILPFDQQELALASGRVDAIGLMQPYILSAKQNDEIKLLFTALDVFGERQFCMHVLNSVWANNNEEAAKAFVSAIVDAVAWIENNQIEAKKIIAKYTGIDTQFIEDYFFQENAAVITQDAQFWLDYMRSRNEISADWLQVSDFATNRFNPVLGE